MKSFNANSITFSISAKEPGYVLYNELIDSHWRAQVNGKETPILKANLAFKAVEVSPGTSVVHFEYFPKFFALSVMFFMLLNTAFFVLALFQWIAWTKVRFQTHPIPKWKLQPEV